MLGLANIVIPVLAFVASIINGAIGYGFSSTITPIAVLFVTNKVLNPALVVCELGVNSWLLISERRNIRSTWRRALPYAVGLLPGVIIGSIALSIIAPTIVKIVLYVVLFPLIIVQIFGLSWPIKKEHYASPVVGAATGFLYSLTTISGPPLALYWRNQGLAKDEFRCIVSQIRVAEASFTTISYFILGLFSNSAVGLVPYIFLPVIIGIPIGIYALRSVSPEFFKRLVMGADGIFVLFGLMNTLGTNKYVPQTVGYEIFAIGAVGLVILTYQMLRRVTKAERRKGPPRGLR